jgi:hypothetical protein
MAKRLHSRGKEQTMDDFVEVGVLRSSLSHDREIAVDAQLLYRVRQALLGSAEELLGDRFHAFRSGAPDAHGNTVHCYALVPEWCCAALPRRAPLQIAIHLWGPAAEPLLRELDTSVFDAHYARLSWKVKLPRTKVTIVERGMMPTDLGLPPNTPKQLELVSPLVSDITEALARSWPTAPGAKNGSAAGSMTHIMPSASAKQLLESLVSLLKQRLLRIGDAYAKKDNAELRSWLNDLQDDIPADFSAHAMRIAQRKPKSGVIGSFVFPSGISLRLMKALWLAQRFSLGESTASYGMGAVRLSTS